MTINDIGTKPQSFNIEHATKENTDYRSVAWSGRYLQVTLMSIPVGEDIGLEAHPETDQFLRLDFSALPMLVLNDPGEHRSPADRATAHLNAGPKRCR